MSNARQIKAQIKEEPAVQATVMQEEPLLVMAGEIVEGPAGTTTRNVDFITAYAWSTITQHEGGEIQAQEREHHQVEKEREGKSTRMKNCTDLAEGKQEVMAPREKTEKAFAIAFPWTPSGRV